MNRIYLVRHGLSESNLSTKVNKRKPDNAIELDKEGHRQAVEAGKFLGRYLTDQENPKVSRIRMMVSPYLRTRQTADGIESQIAELTFPYDRRECLQLREQSFGLFDGLSPDELASEYPRELRHYEKHKDFEGEFFAPMPMGESRARVCDRVRSAFGPILRDFRGEGREKISDVIVVSHGVTIRCFIREFLHLPWEWCEAEPNPNNCSIIKIEGEENRGWTMERIFAGFDHPHDLAHMQQEIREEGHL